jgi:hypothetical protein
MHVEPALVDPHMVGRERVVKEVMKPRGRRLDEFHRRDLTTAGDRRIAAAIPGPDYTDPHPNS